MSAIPSTSSSSTSVVSNCTNCKYGACESVAPYGTTSMPLVSLTSTTSSGSTLDSQSPARSANGLAPSSLRRLPGANAADMWKASKWRNAPSYSSTSSSSPSKSSSLKSKWRRRSFNECFSCFLDLIFYNTGLFIADYALTILAVVFGVTVVCSSKILFTPQEDDIRTGYTPNGAQSHVETRLYEQFYRNITSSLKTFSETDDSAKPRTGSGLSTKSAADDINEPISVVVFVVAKDNGSMLRDSYLNETVWLIDELATRFRIVGKNFYEFCTDFCHLNEPIRQFQNGIFVLNSSSEHSNHTVATITPSDLHDDEDQLEELSTDGLNLVDNDLINAGANEEFTDSDATVMLADRIRLSFPFASIFGVKLDMSPHFFGVEKYTPAQMRQRVRNGGPRYGMDIRFLRLIVLQFRAERPAGATRDDIADWERALTKYLHTERDSPYTRAYVLSIAVVGDEIVRTGMTLFPYITVGFAIMSTFSIATVYISAFYYNQWTVHKVVLALWACVCPLLATSSALGFLFWFGFRFGTILAVSPFLIMAIGVDDAYLMIHAYQRFCAARRTDADQHGAYSKMAEFDAAGGLRDRRRVRELIAAVLVDVGPSITITSLTNVLAFAVGVFSPTPEIQLFCAGNATAIFFDYVYQLFMFTPIITLAARSECRRGGGATEWAAASERRPPSMFVVAPPDSATAAAVSSLATSVTRRQRLEQKLTRFMARYCHWLASGFTTALVAVMLTIYWCASLRGALHIDVNITPKKLFLADSFINEINALRDAYILPNYTALSVFVNRAGDLDQPERLARVRSLIANFESMPNSLGPVFTHFWLRDYDKYVETIRESEGEEEEPANSNATETNGAIRFNAQDLRDFLGWPEYRHWGGFIRFSASEYRIEKFFAVVAYRGADLVGWDRRSELLNEWRRIAANYSDLEAWVWADDAQFLDQIGTLVPATIQSSVATLLCMMLVCGVFMSNLFTVVVATLAIVSICIGVFGCLAFWSIDLDPISMATTIMSIGFSVDFPAHVTYHYYRGGLDAELNLPPEERIYRSLIAIGFPLLQCGLSTILFVLCLLFVDTYMSEVFVKTMVLVVSLGLLHGLFVVPTFLCALSKVYLLLCSTRKKVQRAVGGLMAGDRRGGGSTAKKTPSLRDLVHSTRPVVRIRRRLSKKNIAKIAVADLAA